LEFQNIIAGRKDEYISTSRRLKKDTIANEIRNLIAARQGRFLRRVTSAEKLDLRLGGSGGSGTAGGGGTTATSTGSSKGVDFWAVADEEVVLAKIKQSLRGKQYRTLLSPASPLPTTTIECLCAWREQLIPGVWTDVCLPVCLRELLLSVYSPSNTRLFFQTRSQMDENTAVVRPPPRAAATSAP
jgi:hypothetical protein